jgi:acetyltransferase-like isoleucine patch superfamily enzyme
MKRVAPVALGFLFLSGAISFASAQVTQCNTPVRLTVDPKFDHQPAWNPAADSHTIAFLRTQVLAAETPNDIFAVEADTAVVSSLAAREMEPPCGFGVGHSLSWVGTTGLLMTNERCGLHEYMSVDTTSADIPFTRTAIDGNDAVFTRELFIPGGGGGGMIRISRGAGTALWRHSTAGGFGTTTIRSAPFSSLTGQAANDLDILGSTLYNNLTVFAGAPPQVYQDGAALTPDGSQFILAEPSGVGTDLFLRSTADGSLIQQLTTTGQTSGFENTYPDISPDGTKVAFSASTISAGTLTFDIFEVQLDGTGLTNLTNNVALDAFQPSYSPNGALLAFAAVDQVVHPGNRDIYVMSCFALGAGAVIGDDVTVGAGVTIGDGAIINKDASLGDNSEIGAGSDVQKGTDVGNGVIIGEGVFIAKDVTIGDGVCIGDRTIVEKETTIGNDTTIGTDAIINKQVQIGERVLIGNGQLIALGTIIADDAEVPPGPMVNCPF